MKSLALIRIEVSSAPCINLLHGMGTWSLAHNEANGAAEGRLPCSAKYTSLQILEDEQQLSVLPDMIIMKELSHPATLSEVVNISSSSVLTVSRHLKECICLFTCCTGKLGLPKWLRICVSGGNPLRGEVATTQYSCQDDYSPWGHKELDTSEATEHASTRTSICGDLQVSYIVPRRLKK